jgi:hypothetical protein
MSPTPVSVATLAPLPGAPVAPQIPALPAAPAALGDGSGALGPLPPAPWLVRQKPKKFAMAGVIPLGIAVFLTLVSQLFNWPGTPEAALADARKATESTAQSGQPVWYQAPGVTAPVPLTPWPTIRDVVGYPNHKATVTVRFLVNTDGTVDRTGLTVSGPGSGPVRNMTAVMYAKMRFRPGRVGGKPAPVVMERQFRYPM